MLIVGLTGSIATGNRQFRHVSRLNFRVHDSDKVAHQLMGPGGSAAEQIVSRFGSKVECFVRYKSHPTRQSGVFDPNKRCLLEQILHPIHEQKQKFIQHNRYQRRKVVFLDVPLLFETGGDHYCDRVITVWCPPFLQTIRALRRPGMTEKKLSSVLEAQWPQSDKCFLSDLTLPSSIGRAETLKRLKRWLRSENFI